MWGPDVGIARPSAINSMGKEKNKMTRRVPWILHTWIQHRGQADSTPASSPWSQRKERKSVPTLLFSTSLIWASMASPGAWLGLSPKAGLGLGSRQPGRVPFIEPLFRCYYYFWIPLEITTVCLSQLGPESREWDQSLEDHGGNSHLACTSAAGIPSLSLSPESTASNT